MRLALTIKASNDTWAVSNERFHDAAEACTKDVMVLMRAERVRTAKPLEWFVKAKGMCSVTQLTRGKADVVAQRMALNYPQGAPYRVIERAATTGVERVIATYPAKFNK